MTTAMAPDKQLQSKSNDEPWITLPTMQLLLWIGIGSVAGAGLWSVGAAVLGYGGAVAANGAIGAGLVLVTSAAAVLLLMPWIARPASTGMLLWLASDVASMLLTLGLAYLLYSATFLQSHPLLLGVVLTYFIVLPAKVAVIASHMRKHYY